MSDQWDDLAATVALACLTSDRTDREQKALVRVARKVDRAWNAQLPTNRRLGDARHAITTPPCTYSTDHPKACACRGDTVAIQPSGGWSRLADRATNTRTT